jgi:hypothetical protein
VDNGAAIDVLDAGQPRECGSSKTSLEVYSLFHQPTVGRPRIVRSHAGASFFRPSQSVSGPAHLSSKNPDSIAEWVGGARDRRRFRSVGAATKNVNTFTRQPPNLNLQTGLRNALVRI